MINQMQQRRFNGVSVFSYKIVLLHRSSDWEVAFVKKTNRQQTNNNFEWEFFNIKKKILK